MKYSIIIPVYNTSKYLKKCLDSIINQTYKDYEVIIINDGSTDNSLDIIKEYSSKNKSIKYKSIKNSGLSVARNTGVSLARGEYILFLDSDDYIDKNLLNKLSIYDNDVIRFQVREVLDNDSIIKEYNEHAFKNYNTYDALNIIVNYHFVENAWAYAYKKEFYIKNKFNFMSGIYHEDYALIPLVLCKAKTISSIDYIGYNYVQRSNSIMSSKDYEKIKKKVYDFLKGYDYLYQNINNSLIDDKIKKIMLSYISNSLIVKAKELNKKDINKFIGELKKRKIYRNILDDSLIRKIKKILIKINIKLYLKISR